MRGPLSTQALLSAAGAAAFVGAAAPAEAGAWRFHADHVLGASLDLSVRGVSEGDALLAFSAARAEIARLDALLSVWRDDSEIATLNRSTALRVSPDLYAMLAAGERWRAKTDGAFNTQLGAVQALWRAAACDGAEPDAAILARAAQAAACAPEFDARARTIKRAEGAAFAPDALAKGFIIDAALAAARVAAPNATGLLVDIGGDMRVWGAWRVGISDPSDGADNAAPLAVLALNNQALATSGRGPRDVIVNGQPHAHIFSPRDGRPVRDIVSASVVAARAADADALASAFCVMAPRDSLALANRLPGVEALIWAQDGVQYESAGWRDLVLREAPPRAIPIQAPPATPWPANFQLSVSYEIPEIASANYRKPFVLIWITNANREVVRTLLMLGQREQWQDDNYIWWRRVGRFQPGIVDAISRPTRAPGRYDVVWDGLNDAGQLVSQGAYTLNIEAVREHGGHSYVSTPLTLGAAPVSASTAADAELGVARIAYGRRP